MKNWNEYFINKGYSSDDAIIKTNELIEAANTTYDTMKKCECDYSFDEWCEILNVMDQIYQINHYR